MAFLYFREWVEKMELQAADAKQANRFKIAAINENRDFKRIYARGKSWVSPVLVTYICKNRGGRMRVGITASKKIGNAVKRNRSRRVIRAALQSLFPSLDTGRNVDIIFVARGKTPYVKSTAVEKAMAAHLKEAGLLS